MKFLLRDPTIVTGTGTGVPTAGSIVPETPPEPSATFTVQPSGYYLFIKRSLELGLALYMLVATLPLWLLVAVAVKPGLTSLWAVNGRSRCSFEQWMSYDRRYIQQMSLSLDLTILVQTVWVVLRGTGAY